MNISNRYKAPKRAPSTQQVLKEGKLWSLGVNTYPCPELPRRFRCIVFPGFTDERTDMPKGCQYPVEVYLLGGGVLPGCLSEWEELWVGPGYWTSCNTHGGLTKICPQDHSSRHSYS